MNIKSFKYFKLVTYSFGYWQNRVVETFLKQNKIANSNEVASEHYHIIFDAVEEIHKLYIKEVGAPQYSSKFAKTIPGSNEKIELEYFGEPKLNLIEDSFNIEALTPVRFRTVKKVDKILTVEIDGKTYHNTETSFQYGEWEEAEDQYIYNIYEIVLDLLE